jgi:hypothetical protein
MRRVNYQYLFLGLALLAIVGGLLGCWSLSRAEPLESDPPSEWEQKSAFWEQTIEERGAKGAYEALADHASDLSYSARHVEAHAFGAALFDVEGARGVAICDDQFSFGCFHQFLGDAIAALGLESVPELNAGCFKALDNNSLACQHGIGHGILAAVGYDDDSMRQALDICAKLPGIDPIGGCYSGVFMEYNVRTMLAGAATPRDFTGNPFVPCDALSGTFVPACIYWQPQWWIQAIFGGKADEEEFRQMGEFCREFARTPELERQCFEGIGNIVAMESGFDAPRARALCEEVGNGRQRLLCLSIGANHFGIDVNAEAAALVCDGLTGDSQEYCLAYARNDLNIAKVGRLPL